jgi:AraC family transcriptional regulator, positive regulator of tynA and feaB
MARSKFGRTRKMQEFTFNAYSNSDAVERWRATLLRGYFMRLRPEPAQRNVLVRGRIRRWQIGDLSLRTSAADGQHIHRDAREIEEDDAQRVTLALQLRGEARLGVANERRIARPGDLFLLHSLEPFVLHCTGGDSACIPLTPEIYQEGLGHLQPLHGVVFTPRDPVEILFRDYVLSLVSCGSIASVVPGKDVAEHLLTLARHVLSGRLDLARPDAQRAAVLVRALRLIERNLHNSDFNPEVLARSVGVSLRKLQTLFSDRGMTTARVLLERRVARATEMLRNPANAGNSITQVAFDCGFTDLTHFGRVFAMAHGQTPREWRRAQLAGRL